MTHIGLPDGAPDEDSTNRMRSDPPVALTVERAHRPPPCGELKCAFDRIRGDCRNDRWKTCHGWRWVRRRQQLDAASRPAWTRAGFILRPAQKSRTPLRPCLPRGKGRQRSFLLRKKKFHCSPASLTPQLALRPASAPTAFVAGRRSTIRSGPASLSAPAGTVTARALLCRSVSPRILE